MLEPGITRADFRPSVGDLACTVVAGADEHTPNLQQERYSLKNPLPVGELMQVQ
jgi:hypothetical protein